MALIHLADVKYVQLSGLSEAEKREINPDAKFGDFVLSKFMNCLMIQGKKSVGQLGQCIVIGLMDESFFILFAAGDIFFDGDEMRNRAIGSR